MWRPTWLLLLLGLLLATTVLAGSSSSSSSEEEDDEDDGECACDRAGRGGVISQRIDTQAFRLERLASKLEHVKSELKGNRNSDLQQHAVGVKYAISRIQGSGCGETQFPCGRSNRMCISSLLVCDGTEDCPNGNDESEDVCKNRVLTGSTFSGRISWDACKANPEGDISMMITTNKIVNYFPSRVWLGAKTTFSYDNHGTESHSFDSSGYYNFGTQRIVLQPPSGQHVGAVCTFLTNEILDCQIKSASTLETCASVRLERE